MEVETRCDWMQTEIKLQLWRRLNEFTRIWDMLYFAQPFHGELTDTSLFFFSLIWDRFQEERFEKDGKGGKKNRM